MKLTCPGCGSNYRVDETKITDPSVKMRCRSCQFVFSVSEAGGRTTEAAAAGVTAAETETRGSGAASHRIIVCDDAPFFRTMLRDILVDAGYEVETASGGEEALGKIAASRPALLILDIQMPGMDGYEVIRAIRGGDAAPDLPILAVSGVHTDSSDMIDLEDAGANDYIGKQFKPEHLLKRVRGLAGPPAAGG